MGEIMGHVEKNLKVIINEREETVFNEESRSGTMKR